MSIKDYKEDLIKVFEGSPWYGKSVSKLLSQLEGKDLNKKLEGGNNVAQILEHMITWKKWCVEMFSGNYDYWIKVNSNDDWQREKSYSEADLKGLLNRLNETHKQLLNSLEGKNEEWLQKTIPERKFTFAEALNGAIQHDIYHLGQIALLTK